jgi:hypothetical protein
MKKVDSKNMKYRVSGLFEVTVRLFLYRDLETEINRFISTCGEMLPATSGTSFGNFWWYHHWL